MFKSKFSNVCIGICKGNHDCGHEDELENFASDLIEIDEKICQTILVSYEHSGVDVVYVNSAAKGHEFGEINYEELSETQKIIDNMSKLKSLYETTSDAGKRIF